MATLKITQDVRDSAIVVAVAGDIDSATVGTLVTSLETGLTVASEHARKPLVIDLGEVTYFGSAGLNAVLECYEAGLARGVAVRLVSSAAEVIRPLEVTQLDTVVRPYPTISDALAGRADGRDVADTE